MSDWLRIMAERLVALDRGEVKRCRRCGNYLLDGRCPSYLCNDSRGAQEPQAPSTAANDGSEIVAAAGERTKGAPE